MSALVATQALFCFFAFACTYLFWRSTLAADVMRKCLPTVLGFLSFVVPPLTALFIYMEVTKVLPFEGILVTLGVVALTVMVQFFSVVGFVAGERKAIAGARLNSAQA